MSGIEVAGLLLGAIPLVIEGYHGLEKAFAIYETYRSYPKELKKFEAKLGAQKTVFRNNCINLLSSISNDRPKVYAMLSDSGHVGWHDGDIHRRLASRVEALDESFLSCQRTMEQIHEALQSINREVEAFQAILNPPNEGDSYAINSREWYRRVGTRIKLSLNKPRIETHIEQLRNFNADFDLMSNQIIKSLMDTEISKTTTISHASIPSLLKYQSVRKASQWLYETLVNRWSCSIHSNHWANISLDNEVRWDEAPKARDVQAEDISTVHLEMAITYFAGKDPGDVPIWLEIQSSVDIELMCRALPGLQKFADISGSLESQTGPFITETRQKPKSSKRTVRFDNEPPHEMKTLSLQSRSQTKSQAIETALDLCLVEDVCEHFQLYQRASHQQVCLGYLNDTCTQRFYQPPVEKCLTGRPKSLEDIIIWVSEDPIRILPRSIMIHIAASLATAVLRYHSTPWLSELWRSKDVVFFGLEDFQQGKISLCQPHLNVEFSRFKGKRKAPTEGEEPASNASYAQPSITYGARNEVLFHLGIVLLEVGFATPWATLRTNLLKTIPDQTVSDYVIADKLARLLVHSMGPTYSLIIRKCLGCDFGLGETDLASEELQAKFLLDVVIALQSLEKRFPVI